MKISVTVNRQTYQDEVEPRMLLCYFLRETAGLTGTHIGCMVGECGACSVMLEGRLVKSCQILAVQADGREVTTVEGLAALASPGQLHPVQEAFVSHYALQCGFCTPGMVMASYYLVTQDQDPSEEKIRRKLSGNLCMCTGYTQIVDAVRSAAAALREKAPVEGSMDE